MARFEIQGVGLGSQIVYSPEGLSAGGLIDRAGVPVVLSRADTACDGGLV